MENLLSSRAQEYITACKGAFSPLLNDQDIARNVLMALHQGRRVIGEETLRLSFHKIDFPPQTVTEQTALYPFGKKSLEETEEILTDPTLTKDLFQETVVKHLACTWIGLHNLHELHTILGSAHISLINDTMGSFRSLCDRAAELTEMTPLGIRSAILRHIQNKGGQCDPTARDRLPLFRGNTTILSASFQGPQA